MNSALRALCLSALPLALAACQGETAQQSTAEGEILPGSTSDAMLPYDSVRSQPPLAPIALATGRAARKAGTGEESEDEASVAATEAAAATPVPTATTPPATPTAQ
jgi:hypothetical protein